MNKDLLDNAPRDELYDMLLEACQDGDIEPIVYIYGKNAIKKDSSALQNMLNVGKYAISAITNKLQISRIPDISYNGSALFNAACYYGHLEVVKLLLTGEELSTHIDIKTGKNGFYNACEKGHIDIVKYLVEDKSLREHIDLEYIQSKSDYKGQQLKSTLEKAIYNAFGQENFEIMDYLLGKSQDKHRLVNEVFVKSCQSKDSKAVRFFIMQSEHKNEIVLDDKVIKNACENNSSSVLAYLLHHPSCEKKLVVDPDNSQYLLYLLNNGYRETASYLILHNNMSKTPEISKYIKYNMEIRKLFFTRDLKNSLENNLDEKVSSHKINKI